MSRIHETTLEEVSSLVHDGMRIGLGGFWFVRTPMALVDAVIESGVEDLEIVCFGGGLAVERLIRAERIRRLFFSFHSMDVIGPAPAFRSAVENGRMEAVELTTQVLIKTLKAAEENLPYLPVRGPLQSDFLGEPFPLPPVKCPFTGTRLHAVPALPLDLALIHATTADVEGNIEIIGALGVDRRLVGAAERSVVSVERIAEPFRGPRRAQRTTLPRFLVDRVVHAEGGAAPSSCLPHYGTDLQQVLTELDLELPSSRSAPAVRATDFATTSRTDDTVDEDAATPAEMLVFHLARQLVDHGVYTVGSVTPISMVAYQLAKLTHAPHAAIIPFAGLVDVQAHPVGVAEAESKALATASAYWGMDDLYEKLYEAGRIDAEIFCPAQVDAAGAINNSSIARANGGVIRLPGQAGIADVATLHKNLYMYVPRHSPRRFVERVDFRGGSRALQEDDERLEAGLDPGETTVVTDLCVMRLDKQLGRFRLESLHPGVSLQQVRQATGFGLASPDDPPVSEVPNREILRLIRQEVDPLEVRNLESVPSGERLPLLTSILDAES